MTAIHSYLKTESLDNGKYEMLMEPFIFDSDVLLKAGLKSRVEVPAGFVYDFESVPIVRGTNKRGGTAHDYLCRIDSDPLVTKSQAAAVYFEIMHYCYDIDAQRNNWTKLIDWTKRWTKWAVVRVAWGYFHKFKVMATSKEIAGIDGDPYMTPEEKIDALIKKTETVSADLKDVDIKVQDTTEMIIKTDQVTSDLKDAKAEVKVNLS
jgi:hypothetical protein